MSNDTVNEDRFHAGISQLRRGITKAAVAQLETLRGVDGVVVEFGTGKELSILFMCPKASGSDSSIFNVDTTGRLMLMAMYHRHPKVVALLEAIHQRLMGPPPSDWLDDKPTFASGDWEQCTNSLVEGLAALASGEEPAGKVRAALDFEFTKQAVGPVIRPKFVQGAQGATASPGAGQTSAGMSGASGAPQRGLGAAEPGDRAAEGDAADLEVEDAIGWATAGKDARVRTMVARWLRSRQSAFRRNLLRAYGSRCCISDCGPSAVLEAAHIEDHSLGSDNDTTNGLLLRSDLHSLFDEGLLRIDPARMVVMLHESLMDTPYAVFQGREIRRAVGPGPSVEKLKARWNRSQDSTPH